MVFKKLLMDNLIKNLKNDALSRNLIKSIKSYFTKNLKIDASSCLKSTLSKKKKLDQEAKKRLTIKLKKNTLLKKLIKNLKKVPYQRT